VFEQYEFPFSVVYTQEIDAGNLRAKYDVLVFVDGAINLRGGAGGFGGGGGGGGGGGTSGRLRYGSVFSTASAGAEPSRTSNRFTS